MPVRLCPAGGRWPRGAGAGVRLGFHLPGLTGTLFPHLHKDAARACGRQVETCLRSPAQAMAEPPPPGLEPGLSDSVRYEMTFLPLIPHCVPKPALGLQEQRDGKSAGCHAQLVCPGPKDKRLLIQHNSALWGLRLGMKMMLGLNFFIFCLTNNVA